MVTYLILGGYGEMGRITLHDLFATTKDTVIIVGRDKAKAIALTRSFKSPRVRAVHVDVTNTNALAKLSRRSDVVINCTQYTHNLLVMRAAEEARKPYLDLGGLFHMTKKQLALDGRWKKKGLLAILGCGSTPGITNMLAARGATFFDAIDAVHIRFASYDATQHTSHFVLPYSIATLFDELIKKPAVLRSGHLRFVSPLSGMEEEVFPKPIGKVTSFYTLHSELATFPASFKEKKLQTCDFKVSFPDDLIHDLTLLIELGFSSTKPVQVGNVIIQPLALIQKLTASFTPKRNIDDMEYVRVRMTGKKAGEKRKLVLDCIARSKPSWKASAGAFDTGVPPSVIAQMIVRGNVHATGVLPPEKCIDPMAFFRELEKRGMRIRITGEI